MFLFTGRENKFFREKDERVGKKSVKTIKDIQRRFNLLNKKLERVASAVRENLKLLAKFMKMFE